MSDLLKVDFRVFQGSVLGSLLFLFQIVVYTILLDFLSSQFYLLDTGLLNIQGTISVISKTLEKEPRELSFWLNVNKIALNVAKTENIHFKENNKNYDGDLKIKLFRKRMHPHMLNISEFSSIKT